MIYFVRHGESQANADNIFGDSSSPLTEKGRLQAKKAGEQLKIEGVMIDQVICSTYKRSVDTAMIIVDVIGFNQNQIQYDHRLVEYDCGSAAGKSIDSITRQRILTFDGAEDPYEFKDRVLKAFAEIRNLPGNILVVSHAGVGCMLKTIDLGLPPEKFVEIEDYPNCAIIKLSEV